MKFFKPFKTIGTIAIIITLFIICFISIPLVFLEALLISVFTINNKKNH